jgi:hypothetical protein
MRPEFGEPELPGLLRDDRNFVGDRDPFGHLSHVRSSGGSSTDEQAPTKQVTYPATATRALLSHPKGMDAHLRASLGFSNIMTVNCPIRYHEQEYLVPVRNKRPSPLLRHR